MSDGPRPDLGEIIAALNRRFDATNRKIARIHFVISVALAIVIGLIFKNGLENWGLNSEWASVVGVIAFIASTAFLYERVFER